MGLIQTLSCLCCSLRPDFGRHIDWLLEQCCNQRKLKALIPRVVVFMNNPVKWLYYVGKMKHLLFLSKLCVHIKTNNNSPHGKFHQFLFPFSSKFPDLNFTPYVLYLILYIMKPVCDKQSAWVTCGYSFVTHSIYRNPRD